MERYIVRPCATGSWEVVYVIGGVEIEVVARFTGRGRARACARRQNRALEIARSGRRHDARVVAW